MVARGLFSPVLTISEGAPGLCAALGQVFPQARRQRCLIHRARNTIAKVSEVDQAAVRADCWEIFDIDDTAPADAAVAEAHRRIETFASTWGGAYPSAVACVTDDFEVLVAHLHYPRAHWGRIRHPT